MVVMQKRPRIFIETITLIVLITLQVFIIAISSIDLEQYRPVIMKNINDSLGGRTQLGKIDFSLFPYFGVRGYNFYHSDDKSGSTLSADEVIIGIYIFPIFRGKVVPKKLSVISPTVLFPIGKDEQFFNKMIDIFGKANPKKGTPIPIREVVISNAVVKIADNRLGKYKEYMVTIENGWFKGDLKNGPLTYYIKLSPPGQSEGAIIIRGESLDKGGVVARVRMKKVGLESVDLMAGDYIPVSVKGTIDGAFVVTYTGTNDWNIDGGLKGSDVSIKGLSWYPGGVTLGRIDVSGIVGTGREGFFIRDLAISRQSLEVAGDLLLRKVIHRNGPLDELTIQADVSGFDFKRNLPLIPLGLFDVETARMLKETLKEGRLTAHVEIEGNPAWIGTEAARLEARASIENTTLDLGGATVTGVSADINLSRNDLSIKRVAFRNPPGKIRDLEWRTEKVLTHPAIRGMVVTVDDMAFEDVKDIISSKIVNATPFLRETTGTGRVIGSLKIETPMGNTVGVTRLTGKVDLFDWALSVPFFSATPHPGSASLVFDTDKMIIPKTTITFDESMITAEGELTNFGKPHLAMSIKSPTLDIVELFGKANTTVNLHDLKAKLVFEQGYLLLQDITCTLYGGKCSGYFGYVITKPESGGLFYLNMKGEKTNIERLLSDVEISESITGSVDFSLALTSEPKTTDKILDSLNGKATIVVHNGTVKRLTVLSKIISIMTISNYLRLKIPKLDTEGIPFDSIAGDFVIKNGVMKTENLYFDSRVVKISMTGSYDVINDKLDMVMGFHLLQTIDLIVNKIPVMGYILTGEDGNLFTTYYRVTGSIKDPKVENMTLLGLGEGTLNILGRILRFPLKGFIPR